SVIRQDCLDARLADIWVSPVVGEAYDDLRPRLSGTIVQVPLARLTGLPEVPQARPGHVANVGAGEVERPGLDRQTLRQLRVVPAGAQVVIPRVRQLVLTVAEQFAELDP